MAWPPASAPGSRCWTCLRLLLLAELLPQAVCYTNLTFYGAQGENRIYLGKPAVWNVHLPNFGKIKLSHTTPLDRESYNIHPSFHGRVVLDPRAEYAGNRTLACDPLLAAPPHESVAVLVERGLCGFRQKATHAFNAGFAAMLVSNSIRRGVPDMVAAPDADEQVEIPAWALPRDAGDELRTWLASDHSIVLEIADIPRWTQLGPFQGDEFGERDIQRV
eukprot:gnl/TRDRNA2_/TRDRNA2_188849_c0_seq1.p1 gnl/TRDRNA2_/TRDRNA2_188849_c0~~gnl/TRDRNA2_/TRDRNA2_188849_c0_seq1.p1  ORF type:complete len:219 (+),score=20.85 gnl/TRDRNA2_/TRDRNA2_188849_c0_seq1:69-725(+)